MNYKPEKKLKLAELKVRSFSTELGNSEKVLGGSGQLHHLMLQDHADISHYGLIVTSNEVFTGKMRLSAIRSNG